MNVSGLGSLLGVAGERLGGAGHSGGSSPLGGRTASPLGGFAALAEGLLGGGGADRIAGTAGATSDPFSEIEALTSSVDELATSGLSLILGGSGGFGSIAGLLA